jgi:hypothetical protein
MQNMPQWKVTSVMIFSHFNNITAKTICAQHGIVKYSVIQKDWLSHQFEQIFVQIGDSNDKCSSSLEVECWNEDETHAAQQSPTQF